MVPDIVKDIENCFAAGWSDGLPVVPPYGTLVDAMVEALGWRPTDVVGTIEAQSLEVRAEHIGAAAVMAGCEIGYARVLRPLAECLFDKKFHISGSEVTTGGVSATVVVGGPVVGEIGFAHEANALGANARPNATIGRFAQMVRLFCGRAGGTLQTHGTVGHPGRISFLIAEHPETLWPNFHTQFDHAPGQSAVSVFATEGPNSVNNHFASTGEQVLETIADCIAHAGTTNIYYRHGAYLIALAPDHAELVTREFTREAAAAFLYERARLSTDEMIRLGRIPENPRSDLDVVRGTMRPPVRGPHRFHFIETGAPGGKFSAVIPHWAGSRFDVSRPIPPAN